MEQLISVFKICGLVLLLGVVGACGSQRNISSTHQGEIEGFAPDFLLVNLRIAKKGPKTQEQVEWLGTDVSRGTMLASPEAEENVPYLLVCTFLDQKERQVDQIKLPHPLYPALTRDEQASTTVMLPEAYFSVRTQMKDGMKYLKIERWGPGEQQVQLAMIKL